MNQLTDKEILALHALCNAVTDGTITETQKAQLSHWLVTSRKARQYYIRTMGLSASLYSYASEMQTEAPDAFAPRPPINIISVLFRWLAPLAAAAAIALVSWIEWPKQNTISAVAPVDEFVAQLTGSKECQWASGAALLPGARLHKGQPLELTHGFAEVTFDSGARVVLEGPALLEVNSAWDAILKHGTLKANVPPEAIGFSVSDQTVNVVDLGTEFTMIADASGATDLLVLKGAVEASPQNSANPQTILLHKNEARRFAASGVSDVHDSEQKFARYTQSVPLDHFTPPTDYMHWSFDETDGDIFKADASGTLFDAADLRLENISPSEFAAAHGAGHWGHALQFDGRMFAKAAFSDISENMPHTVVFWVKVPKDANLSNAYAMVAWGMNSKNFGSHPIHIGWNRNPNEGTVGVLRTDYGGGFAVGSTSLRDGLWHHISVVLIPGADAKSFVEVRQYVDGRFEGEGKPSPPGSEIFTKLSGATSGTVWLGCRLGINDVRQERFRGEMDELFIADRALEPLEIVQLMKDNRLPQPELAAVKK